MGNAKKFVAVLKLNMTAKQTYQFKRGIIVEDLIAKIYPKLLQIDLGFFHMRE